MGTPEIYVGSEVAKALGTSEQDLVKRSGKTGNEIWIWSLARNTDGLKGKLIEVPLKGDCVVSVIVDNGDGKVGEGDLYLKTSESPPCVERNQLHFAFAKLFASPKSMTCPGKNSISPPDEVKRVLDKLEKFKGETWDNMGKQLKNICSVSNKEIFNRWFVNGLLVAVSGTSWDRA